MTSTVSGYLLQALGIGLFCLAVKHWPGAAKSFVYFALLLNMITMVPAVVSDSIYGAITFGLLMNAACGWIAGYYLYHMTRNTPAEHRALAFGIGYGLATLVSWLMTLIGGGAFYYSEYILAVCGGMTLLAFGVIHRTHAKAGDAGMQSVPVRVAAAKSRERTSLIPAALLIFLFGLVNSSGFSFSVTGVDMTVSIELSRIVYGAGLIIAGIVTDRSRQYGAITALTVLVIPFIILALQGEALPAAVFWMLSYFTFGFYSVYRVILFSDIACERGTVWLVAAGLAIGRTGEAAGEGIFLSLKDHFALLVLLTALLFILSVIVFFFVYHRQYLKEPEPGSERERFERFAIQHDLSSREREVLRMIIEEKTNAEIAEALCISENTVKFHVRNLLQKTGCRNRKELHSEYYQAGNPL
ncbi:MAG: hypothetical protein IJ109_01130 [Firmicutes bacterium]|nr:hypothetical protein [Bacillota bacterium]